MSWYVLQLISHFFLYSRHLFFQCWNCNNSTIEIPNLIEEIYEWFLASIPIIYRMHVYQHPLIGNCISCIKWIASLDQGRASFWMEKFHDTWIMSFVWYVEVKRRNIFLLHIKKYLVTVIFIYHAFVHQWPPHYHWYVFR